MIWKTGILADQVEKDYASKSAVLFFLLSHQGEGGHCCPIACTSGLIKAIQEHEENDSILKTKFLPKLLMKDYSKADKAA